MFFCLIGPVLHPMQINSSLSEFSESFDTVSELSSCIFPDCAFESNVVAFWSAPATTSSSDSVSLGNFAFKYVAAFSVILSGIFIACCCLSFDFLEDFGFLNKVLVFLSNEGINLFFSLLELERFFATSPSDLNFFLWCLSSFLLEISSSSELLEINLFVKLEHSERGWLTKLVDATCSSLISIGRAKGLSLIFSYTNKYPIFGTSFCIEVISSLQYIHWLSFMCNAVM